MKEHEPAPPSPEEVLKSVQEARRRPSRLRSEAREIAWILAVFAVVITFIIWRARADIEKTKWMYKPAVMCPSCRMLEYRAPGEVGRGDMSSLFVERNYIRERGLLIEVGSCVACGDRVKPQLVMTREIDGVLEVREPSCN